MVAGLCPLGFEMFVKGSVASRLEGWVLSPLFGGILVGTGGRYLAEGSGVGTAPCLPPAGLGGGGPDAASIPRESCAGRRSCKRDPLLCVGSPRGRKEGGVGWVSPRRGQLGSPLPAQPQASCVAGGKPQGFSPFPTLVFFQGKNQKKNKNSREQEVTGC